MNGQLCTTGLVGGAVVADDVDRQPGLGLTVDLFEEATNVDSPVLGGSLASPGFAMEAHR
ncbi:hypothetical protein OG905_09280 [Streptomyces sp. NBC_00322]|uniref:hypothetical protein n=1 Tax=Streptomyces sp. NBC_00322 TaxID=2975712 RepID=UPI002E2E2BC8|nr:hypothetical protein [Streptomyces sp. NBC_00322]